MSNELPPGMQADHDAGTPTKEIARKYRLTFKNAERLLQIGRYKKGVAKGFGWWRKFEK